MKLASLDSLVSHTIFTMHTVSESNSLKVPTSFFHLRLHKWDEDYVFSFHNTCSAVGGSNNPLKISETWTLKDMSSLSCEEWIVGICHSSTLREGAGPSCHSNLHSFLEFSMSSQVCSTLAWDYPSWPYIPATTWAKRVSMRVLTSSLSSGQKLAKRIKNSFGTSQSRLRLFFILIGNILEYYVSRITWVCHVSQYWWTSLNHINVIHLCKYVYIHWCEFTKIPTHVIQHCDLLDSIDFKWEFLLPALILTLIKAAAAQLWKEGNDDDKIGFWSICQILSSCTVSSPPGCERVQIWEERLPSKAGRTLCCQQWEESGKIPPLSNFHQFLLFSLRPLNTRYPILPCDYPFNAMDLHVW